MEVVWGLLGAALFTTLRHGPDYWRRYWTARGQAAFVYGWVDELVGFAGDMHEGARGARDKRTAAAGRTSDATSGGVLPDVPKASPVVPKPDEEFPGVDIRTPGTTEPDVLITEMQSGTPPPAPSAHPFAEPSPAEREQLRDEEELAREELSALGLELGAAFAYSFAAVVVFRFVLWLCRRGIIRKEALRGVDLFFDRASVVAELGMFCSLLFQIGARPIRMLQSALKSMKFAEKLDAKLETDASSHAGLGFAASDDLGWCWMFPLLFKRHKWIICSGLIITLLVIVWTYTRENFPLSWSTTDLAKAGKAMRPDIVEAAAYSPDGSQGVVDEARRLPPAEEREPSGSGVGAGRRNIARRVQEARETAPRAVVSKEMPTRNPTLETKHVAIPLYGDDGERIGWACHVKVDGKSMVLSVSHVVEADGGAFWDSGRKQRVAVKTVFRTFPEYQDNLVVLSTEGVKTQLPKAMQAERPGSVDFVTITCGTQVSSGFGEMAQDGQGFEHNASTMGGWSGAPIYSVVEGNPSRHALIGLHQGAKPGRGINVGLPFFV